MDELFVLHYAFLTPNCTVQFDDNLDIFQNKLYFDVTIFDLKVEWCYHLLFWIIPDRISIEILLGEKTSEMQGAWFLPFMPQMELYPLDYM